MAFLTAVPGREKCNENTGSFIPKEEQDYRD